MFQQQQAADAPFMHNILLLFPFDRDLLA